MESLDDRFGKQLRRNFDSTFCNLEGDHDDAHYPTGNTDVASPGPSWVTALYGHLGHLGQYQDVVNQHTGPTFKEALLPQHLSNPDQPMRVQENRYAII